MLLCRYQQNLGALLSPPLRTEHSLGPLLPQRITVEGKSWKESSTDIAIAGVGWLGIGVAGLASFDVWTHDGEPHALLGLKTWFAAGMALSSHTARRESARV